VAAATRDDGANLDLVVVLDHLAVRQQLVTANDHGRAGEDVQLGEEATHGPTSGDLDRAPLGVQMDPHARLVGYHGTGLASRVHYVHAVSLDSARVRQ